MDCNLACKYCYEFCKKKEVIKEEYWKAFIDLILTDPDILKLSGECRKCVGLPDDEEKYDRNAIVLDLIGGDSLMHPQLVEDILLYFKYKSVMLDSKYKNNYRISLSSNGVTLLNPEARRVMEENNTIISLGISLDGCKAVHDLNRIKVIRGPNGEELGSFDDIMRIWPWYMKHFPALAERTKATWSSLSIPYLYKSLLTFKNLGIKYIVQNTIMEYDPRDDKTLDALCEQFLMMIDFYKDNYDCMYGQTFDYDFLANTRSYKESLAEDEAKAKCGASNMPCVGTDGKIYGCFRALPHAGRDTSPLVIGHALTGIKCDDPNDYIFRSHKEVYASAMTREQKCKDCEIESACPYCPMGCWQEFGEFRRTTHVCNTIKLEVAFAKAYWEWFITNHPDRAKAQKNKIITWEKDQKYRLIESAFEDKALIDKWQKRLRDWCDGKITFDHEANLKKQAEEDGYYWWYRTDNII